MSEKNGKKGAPSGGKGSKKLGQKMQKMITAMFMALIGFVNFCLGMKKKSEEGNPVLKVTIDGDSGREYLLTVSDPAEVKTLAETQAEFNAMIDGKPEPAQPKATSTGLNIQVERVMKLLTSLQELPRYANMVIGLGDIPGTIKLIMPDKKTKFNYSVRDMKRLVRMANNASGEKRMEQMNEIDFCIKLLAMQGKLEVGKTFKAPSLVVVYMPKKRHSFHDKKVMYSMTMENGVPDWNKGHTEYVARDKRGKVVFWTKINNLLKKANFIDKTDEKAVKKGWYYQIKMNKKGQWILNNKVGEVLEAAKKAGVLKDYSFRKEFTDDIEAPVKGLKHTLAGLIMSTTNAVSTGAGHIGNWARERFCNISLKRLLEGHPDEVSRLNEENITLLGELRSLLKLDDWRIPAIYTTHDREWNPHKQKNLRELMDSGLLASVVNNDVKALSERSSSLQLECVPHARLLNRYWKFTEVATTWTKSENYDEMIDLVSVPAQEPAGKSAE